MNLGLSLILLGALLVASALIAATETALFSLSHIERRRLQDRHPRLGRLVNDLLKHPRRAIVTLLIGSNVTHIAAAAIVTLLGITFLGAERVGILVTLFTLLLIFFGEILPKVFAVRNNESVALATAPFLEFLSVLLLPVRRLVHWVGDWILGFLLRGRKEASDLMSAAELKVLVKIGEEEGILDREERRMIQKIFALGEHPVRAIMTPRTDVVGVRLSDSWEKQVEVIKNFHFSHFPVYQESLDQIAGVLSTQEVILSGQKLVEPFLRPVFYVPELKRIDELLRDFQKSGGHFAVCIDEFGGTAGVVTLEDILEEIFGEYYDEYSRSEQPIRETGGGEFLVDGKVSLANFNDYFRSQLQSKEAETLSGFVMETMGRVPKKNEQLDCHGFHFRIHDMVKQRILKIAVRRKP